MNTATATETTAPLSESEILRALDMFGDRSTITHGARSTMRRGTGPLGLNCDDAAIADADNARARRPRKGARS